MWRHLFLNVTKRHCSLFLCYDDDKGHLKSETGPWRWCSTALPHTHITVCLPAQSTTVHLCASHPHIAVLVPAGGLRRAASSVCSCFIHNQQANLITLWWRAVNFTVSQTLLLPKNWGHPSLIYEAITCNVMKSPSEQDPCHWNNNEL